jgi:hypothetical protein
MSINFKKLFSSSILVASLLLSAGSVFAAEGPNGSATHYVRNVTATSISVRATPDVSAPAIYTLSNGADTVDYYGNESDTYIGNGYYAYYVYYPRSGSGNYNSSNVGYATETDGYTEFLNVATYAQNYTSSNNHAFQYSNFTGNIVATISPGSSCISNVAADDNPNAWDYVPGAYQSPTGWINGWYFDAY